jgi:hypothetical protein
MNKWPGLILVLVILSCVNAALYLTSTKELGLPLDDAWIHQVYARNLGLHGILSFAADQPSTGETAPLWASILALGYVINAPFLPWAFLWGSIFAVATSLAAAAFTERVLNSFAAAFLVAVANLIEWDMAWASLSGMETCLFAFLTLVFLLLMIRRIPPQWMGILAGILFLVRPESCILAGIYGLSIWFPRRNSRKWIVEGIRFLAPLFLIVGPVAAFYLASSGRPFPNTVYAKFLQYGYPFSIMKSASFLGNIFLYFLKGPLALMIPAAAVAVYYVVKERGREWTAPLLWIASLIGIYSVLMPAIFDKGRYFIPLIPLIVILGVEGWRRLRRQFGNFRLLWPATMILFLIMVVILWVNGVKNYSLQVDIYDQTHMAMADWISKNTPRDSVIATHDIGILGYQTERRIMDLAGLVTPEVLPLMHDPQQLAMFLRSKNVCYLAVYQGYYQALVDAMDARLIVSPNSEELTAMGRAPFELYLVESCSDLSP